MHELHMGAGINGNTCEGLIGLFIFQWMNETVIWEFCVFVFFFFWRESRDNWGWGEKLAE